MTVFVAFSTRSISQWPHTISPRSWSKKHSDSSRRQVRAATKPTWQKSALFTRVLQGINEPEGQLSGLANAADLVRSYLRSLGITDAPTTPEPASPSEVEALRAQLPPPVQPGSGSKTHGRWFATDHKGGEISSGDDQIADEVWRLLREAGLPRPGRPFTASHAEMKLAAHMRTNRIRRAEMVINNRPCKLDYGCETLLGVILPEGFSLTIHGTNGYRQTFTGGQRAPWRR